VCSAVLELQLQLFVGFSQTKRFTTASQPPRSTAEDVNDKLAEASFKGGYRFYPQLVPGGILKSFLFVQRDFCASILSHATHNKKCVQIHETQRDKNGKHLSFVELYCGATKQLLKYVQYPRSALSLTMISAPFRLASLRIDCSPIVHVPNYLAIY
jgi:hypothetical protein